MRCPVCRAADNDGPQCRRCKADLTLLIRLEQTRERLLAAARRYAAWGDAKSCTRHAEQAHQLRSDAESLRLLAIGALLGRDFAGAWSWYCRGRNAPPATEY